METDTLYYCNDRGFCGCGIDELARAAQACPAGLYRGKYPECFRAQDYLISRSKSGEIPDRQVFSHQSAV